MAQDGNPPPGPVSGAWKRPANSGSGGNTRKENALGCTGCLGMLVLWIASIGLVAALAAVYRRQGKVVGSSYLELFHILGLQSDSLLFPASLGLFILAALVVLVTGRGIFRALDGIDERQATRGEWDAEVVQRRGRYRKILLTLFWIAFLLLLCPLLLYPLAAAGIGGELAGELWVSLATIGNGFGALLLFAAMILYAVSFVAIKPRGVTREQVVYEELSRIVRELQYFPQGGLDQRIVQQSKLLPFCNAYRDNDLVRGIYRDIPFQQADVSMSGMLERRAVKFSGRWMVLQIPKRVTGEFFILYRKFPVTNREHIRQSGMQRVELEDTAFHQGFEIWAVNPHDVFYVITPALIERLKALVGIGSPAPLLHGIAVCCQGNLLHFAVNGVDDAFQHIFLGATGEENTRSRVRRDISLITDLIDTVAAGGNNYEQEEIGAWE